jgi:apolipoprotein N-acyltransferase
MKRMAFPKFFKSRTFLPAAAGAALFWAALPPADLWLLAWLAPVPWILLVRRKSLAGPKPYLALWIVGYVFTVASLHWLRLPHPATGLGLLALAVYFGLYLPVFVGVSRVAVHRFGCSPIVAAPIVWTGLELARVYVFTGMSMGDISHTQYRWVELIQIADLSGQFGVGFTIVFVAACIARMIPCEISDDGAPPAFRLTYWPIIPAVVLLAAVLGYGYWRTSNLSTRPGPVFALIQGSIDTQFNDDDPQIIRDRFFDQYFALSQKAVREASEKGMNIDLIVWPEIYFKGPLITYDADVGDKDPSVEKVKITSEEFRRRLIYFAEQTRQDFRTTTKELGIAMLIGLDTQHYTAQGLKYFNSAAYLSKTGKLLGRYDKMHLVPFGEYIPMADILPWLYHGFTPLSGGMTPGKEPAAFDLTYLPPRSDGEKSEQTIRFAPNICYETVLSRVIRGQINTLQSQGREPDVLVNLSNDGWYWSSSELDMLFACSVFRAVEFHKPYVIAANTGFSASIDASGRVLRKGPRHDPATLLAQVEIDSRRSFYLDHGDWFAGVCLAVTIFFALAGLTRRRIPSLK